MAHFGSFMPIILCPGNVSSRNGDNTEQVLQEPEVATFPNRCLVQWFAPGRECTILRRWGALASQETGFILSLPSNSPPVIFSPAE